MRAWGEGPARVSTTGSPRPLTTPATGGQVPQVAAAQPGPRPQVATATGYPAAAVVPRQVISQAPRQASAAARPQGQTQRQPVLARPQASPVAQPIVQPARPSATAVTSAAPTVGRLQAPRRSPSGGLVPTTAVPVRVSAAAAVTTAATVPNAPSAVAAKARGPDPSSAQGQVQRAFASQVGWEAAVEGLLQQPQVQEAYGEMLADLSAKDLKILQVRTLVPLAKASYRRKPQALSAKRAGILNGFRDAAERKGVAWRSVTAGFEARGTRIWEAERAAVRNPDVELPPYYLACYEGPIHSYDRGNGEWLAAFDAPSAYLLVHMHHYPDLTPQQAFDALHEEFDLLALKHLLAKPSRQVRCVDIGCGVGTSTFSTARSLERAGRRAKVTGVDLSDYFVTVAKFIKEERAAEFGEGIELDFVHGNGLKLKGCGFADNSVELVTISEVTHEMPKATSEALFKEAARVLAPGGVLGYLDLNPVQALKDNQVGNLVDRIATSNEPYFDEYLELDVPAAMRAAGLEVLEETWPHQAKYQTLESCSLRILVARKPAQLSLQTWTGSWALDRRENWTPYLRFLGLPEAVHEAATSSPDFHEYEVGETSFFMDHKIPGKNLHLRYTGLIDDVWHESPYPKPTAVLFDEEREEEDKSNPWKHRWVNFPTSFETTIPGFSQGKTVQYLRELTGVDEIQFTVKVLDGETGEMVVGPCLTWMRRTGTERPQSVAEELRERFAQGFSRSIEWRLAAIDRVSAMVLENVDAISEAQAADHVSPSSFQGAAAMLRGAVAFYKANLPAWAAPRPAEETLPPQMRTEGDWQVMPEPKGVGLVIAPWNAPALLCILPLLGMLAAGNLCILKPSEAAPATSRLMARLVGKYFPDRSVVVAEGGRETVESLVDAKVDHILFTGGGEVAKQLLARAARHLTPVTLELGGKNPCFVDKADRAQLELYAAEIIGTKSYFNGQFCQAHDYCLVHEAVFDEFVAILEAALLRLSSDTDFRRLINARHAKRVRELARDQELMRPQMLPIPQSDDDATVRLAIIVEPPLDSPVMQQEIFGPLLPVLRVAGASEAAIFIRSRPKPLVVYCYSPEPTTWTLFQEDTSSGNLAINCGPQRMQSNFNVGFGGVGESGYGYSIWGRAVFDDLSNQKAVFVGKQFAGSVWGAAAPALQGQGSS